MDTYLIHITQFAENQLSDIKNYIANDLHAVDSAIKVLGYLEHEINKLSQMPHRIVLVAEEPWHSEGIHKMVIRNFIVYFLIDELNMIVHITAVVHKKRDQLRQLLNSDMK